jgi:hypothetical protein
MNRSSTPRVRYHVLLYAIVAALLAGCGGDDSEPQQPPRSGKPSVLRAPGESGTLDAKACDMLRAGTVGRAVGVRGNELRARPNDSLDLTICEWQGGRVRSVKLMVDSAPRAQLRYYNQLSEQLQFYNQDPKRRPYKIKHVGDDSAYGGAGAWWTRTKGQLVAYADARILRIRAPMRRAAVQVARRAFRRLSEPGR